MVPASSRDEVRETLVPQWERPLWLLLGQKRPRSIRVEEPFGVFAVVMGRFPGKELDARADPIVTRDNAGVLTCRCFARTARRSRCRVRKRNNSHLLRAHGVQTPLPNRLILKLNHSDPS